MASFQAKIGWKRLRKRENNKYRFVSSLPDSKQKIRKNSKTIEKIKKNTIMALFQSKSVGKSLGSEKIKIIVPFRPYQTHN